MAFRKTIFAKALDLRKDALGEFTLNALTDHTCHKTITVVFNTSTIAPRPHITAQQHGLARRIVRRHHRLPNHSIRA